MMFLFAGLVLIINLVFGQENVTPSKIVLKAGNGKYVKVLWDVKGNFISMKADVSEAKNASVFIYYQYERVTNWENEIKLVDYKTRKTLKFYYSGQLTFVDDPNSDVYYRKLGDNSLEIHNKQKAMIFCQKDGNIGAGYDGQEPPAGATTGFFAENAPKPIYEYVEINANEIKEYSGTYVNESKDKLTIKFADNKLFLGRDEHSIQFLRTKNGDYVNTDYDLNIKFNKNSMTLEAGIDADTYIKE